MDAAEQQGPTVRGHWQPDTEQNKDVFHQQQNELAKAGQMLNKNSPEKPGRFTQEDM